MGAIPPGTFSMCSSQGGSDETPRHEVQLPHGLLMGRTPVTQGLYRAITGENPAQYKTSNLHPVEKVSWFDAVRFCNALSRVCGLEEAYTIGEGAKPTVSCSFDAQGFRLPTEAEWEYAAKAGQDFEYSGSNDLSEVAWYYSNSVGSRAQSVGQKRPNAWGLYDMSGSVWEWCWDWYDEDEYRNRATLFGDTATMVNSPKGPKTGVDRVLRGGSHSDVSWCLRTSGRSRLVPVKSDWNSGFRLALSYN